MSPLACARTLLPTLMFALWSVSAAAEPIPVCDESCELSCDECSQCTASNGCPKACDECERCEEECVYWDSTPICNYLDRGLNDHEVFTQDGYPVFQDNLRVLDDLDHLKFGLDLPADHCVANNHSVPCADKDDSTEWWIDSVRLSSGGVVLFQADKPVGAINLLIARGGAGDDGIVGFNREELRTNPSWGLSENDIQLWFTRLPVLVDDDADPTTPPPIPDPVPGLAPAVLEFSGAELAEQFEGLLGRELARFAKEGDCEGKTYCGNLFFGAHWSGTYGLPIPDCDFGACPAVGARKPSPFVEVSPGNSPNTLRVSADLEVVLGVPDLLDCPFGPPCAPNTPKGQTFATLASAGFQLDYELQCLEDGGAFVVRLERTGLSVDLEGLPFIDLFEGRARRLVDDLLADAASQNLPFTFSACPQVQDLVTVGADGGLTFAARPYPPGSKWMFSTVPVRYARWAVVPPAVAPRTAIQNQFGAHVANIPWTGTLASAVPDTISGPINPNEKRTFAQVQEAMATIAALQALCPAINFDLLKMPPFDLDPAQAILCSSAGVGPLNNSRCNDLGKMKAFLLQKEISLKCIPAGPRTNASMAAIYQTVLDAIAVAQGVDLPPLEQQLPILGLKIDVKTGRQGAKDNFAFVDFSDPAEVPAAVRQKVGCRNRSKKSLVPNPYEYPGCADPDDPQLAGTPGCPCAPVDIFTTEEVADDGGFPDGVGSYPPANFNGPGLYCDDGLATIPGNEMVCGAITQGNGTFPVCVECGVTTKTGCACSEDADCQGHEEGLMCWGADDVWPGQSGGGKCLPAPVGKDGREALEEMPWFCLDNCVSLGIFQDWNVPGCLFRQSGPAWPHGTCVDLSPDGPCMPGECQDSEGECGVQHCVECTVHTDCPVLGFPDDYACDSGGHCVPPECAGPEIDFAYCQLFR